MSIRNCTNCGREVADGKRFCAGCGQSIALLTTTAEPEPVAPSCASCGAALAPGKRFCARCGHPVVTAVPVVQAEPEEAGNAPDDLLPAVISATSDEMTAPDGHPNRNTTGVIVIAAMVMVAVCGFLAWNSYRHRKIASRISYSKQQVQEAVSIWADAFRSRNSTSVAASYATTVEKYFRRDNVSRDQIHGYFQVAFNRIGYINTYQIDDIKIELLPALNNPSEAATPSRAAATFHKTWDTKQFDGKTSSGEEIERLTFAKSPEGWKIVREEELSVIRATRH